MLRRCHSVAVARQKTASEGVAREQNLVRPTWVDGGARSFSRLCFSSGSLARSGGKLTYCFAAFKLVQMIFPGIRTWWELRTGERTLIRSMQRCEDRALSPPPLRPP